MKSIHSRLRWGAGAVIALALSTAGCSGSGDSPAAPSEEPSGSVDAGEIEDPGAPDGGTADAGSDPVPGGEDVAVEPPAPAYEASFTPEAGSTDGAFIRAELSPVDTTHVAIEVRAGGMDEVFGVAFRLRWDPALLRWTGGSAKDVLTGSASKGVTTLLEREPGELVYGHALFPNPTKGFFDQVKLQGAPIEDAVLLRVELEVLAAGETKLAFVPESRDVRDPDGGQLSTSWAAGTVKISAIEGGAR